ncbi:hypothetical protein [Microbacterium aurum]|nr:hypothetical protein [Microbacterium aurum]
MGPTIEALFRTARVFGRVVAGLRDRGLVLVTVDALFGGAVPAGIVRHG